MGRKYDILRVIILCVMIYNISLLWGTMIHETVHTIGATKVHEVCYYGFSHNGWGGWAIVEGLKYGDSMEFYLLTWIIMGCITAFLFLVLIYPLLFRMVRNEY